MSEDAVSTLASAFVHTSAGKLLPACRAGKYQLPKLNSMPLDLGLDLNMEDLRLDPQGTDLGK